MTDAIRAALVAANGSPGGEAVPGDTYYGICGSTSYAVAHFEPAANATLQEQVSFQDDGTFRSPNWRYSGSKYDLKYRQFAGYEVAQSDSAVDVNQLLWAARAGSDTTGMSHSKGNLL